MKHVAVLYGGVSAEREVSLRTGAACVEALRECGYEVSEVVVDGPDFVLPDRTELAFLSLHGTFGEDGQVQDILAARGIPFTGANAAVSRWAASCLGAKCMYTSVVDRLACPIPSYWSARCRRPPSS